MRQFIWQWIILVSVAFICLFVAAYILFIWLQGVLDYLQQGIWNSENGLVRTD